ncbi:MAG: ROK family protein, partial [Acidimicrobiia bacterium]
WGNRANEFVSHVNRLFSPTRIVVGGGVSRKWENFAHLFDSSLPVVPALLANNAGVVGAAALAI